MGYGTAPRGDGSLQAFALLPKNGVRLFRGSAVLSARLFSTNDSSSTQGLRHRGEKCVRISIRIALLHRAQQHVRVLDCLCMRISRILRFSWRDCDRKKLLGQRREREG